MLRMFLKYSVFLRKHQDSLQMFLILCDNSNLGVLINFVLIKNKHKICAYMRQLNKGKQRLTKVNKGKQSWGLLKIMKSLRTFESCENF